MLWIRIDTTNIEISPTEYAPADGEWVAVSEALRIIRGHNERKAREEQGAEGDIRQLMAQALGMDWPCSDFVLVGKARELVRRVETLTDHRLRLTAWMRMFLSALKAWSKTERGHSISIKSIASSWRGQSGHGEKYVQENLLRKMKTRHDRQGDGPAKSAGPMPSAQPMKIEPWPEDHGPRFDPTGEGSAYQGKLPPKPTSWPNPPPPKKFPQPWDEESSRRILSLVEERDRFRDLATQKTKEAEDNLVRAVLAERKFADLLSHTGKVMGSLL